MAPDAPEHRTLEYLSTIPTDALKGIGPTSMRALSDAGIRSVADLILTPPRHYIDRSKFTEIAAAQPGEEVTVGETLSRGIHDFGTNLRKPTDPVRQSLLLSPELRLKNMPNLEALPLQCQLS